MPTINIPLKYLNAVLIFNFITLAVFSQHANTFLYRVTGNGLEKPSYLFGTIHLRDSRLFNFQDSLYQYIQSCDVFANEVEPDSITGKIMEWETRKTKRVPLGEQLGPDALARVKKNYQYLSDVPLEELTVQELIAKGVGYYGRKEVKDPMVTFMDMYLMGLAKDWGKAIKGLEKVEDQIDMFDKLIEGKDPEKILESSLSKKKKTDLLIKVYLQNDLETLAQYVAGMPTEMEAIFLSNRNKVMLESMEAIMPGSSLFAAVGAAHLPGPQGLIQLLRSKGYTVTPELSASRTHARDFVAVDTQEKNTWVKTSIEKDGYEILMPGTPSRNLVPESGTDMYTFIDWQNGEQYFSLHMMSEMNITDQNRDSILKAVLKAVADNGELIRGYEPLTINGFTGFDMMMKDPENTFFRTCILNKGNEIIMLMMGAPNELTLSGSKSVRFLYSLKAIPRKMEPFKEVSDPFYGFTVQMPGSPTTEINDSKGERVGYKQYYSKQAQHEFLTLVVFCRPGFSFPNDTATMQVYQNRLKEEIDTVLQVKEGLEKFVFPFRETTLLDKNGKINTSRIISRGNRLYLLLYVSPKSEYSEKLAEDFFQGFSFLPYSPLKLLPKNLDSISVMMPDTSFFYYSNEESIDSSIVQFYIKPVSTTFTIFSRHINPRLWGESDSAFLHNAILKDIDQEDYTIQNLKYFQQEGNPAMDIEFNYPFSHQTLKWRYIKSGDQMFLLNYQYEPGLEGEWVHQMFDSFKVVKKYPAFDVTSGSPELLFAQLDTASVEPFKEILEEFGTLPFIRKDLPLLFEKAAIKHPADTLGYPSLEDEIWGQIESLTDSQDVTMILDHWKPVDSILNYQSQALVLLAQWHTPEALVVLKKLYPEVREADPIIGQVFANLNRDKETIATFFPEWYASLGDLRLGPPVLYLHLMARDSGWIENDPQGYADSVLLLGRKLINFYAGKNPDDWIFCADDVLTALGRLNSLEGNALLAQMANDFKGEEYLMLQAIELLVKNGEKPLLAIQYLSAKPEWRSSLYSMLVENNHKGLFPAQYLTQQAMAESYLYDYLEDYYPDTLESIGSRKMKFEGKDYIFYLFKAGFEEEDGMAYYLGVSGPFDLNGKTIELPEGISQIAGTVNDKFEKSKIDKQLKAFIKEYESEAIVSPPIEEGPLR